MVEQVDAEHWLKSQRRKVVAHTGLCHTEHLRVRNGFLLAVTGCLASRRGARVRRPPPAVSDAVVNCGPNT